MDKDRYGPWAVIAGGSEGIGVGLATQLAADGFGLVLVARKPEPLEETAELARAAGAEVRTVAVDLTAPDMLAAIRAQTDDVDVGLLVINAGANAYGTAFVDGELDRFRTVVTLNTTARMELCHHFGGRLKARGRGGIIMVGSLSGFAGSSHISVYAAAKAFSRVLAEGLWFELRPFGVEVVEAVVGGVRTPAMARRGMTFGPNTSDPADVAAEVLAHVGDGPVYTSELAGGQATAERLTGWPRGPIVEASSAALLNTGLYQ